MPNPMPQKSTVLPSPEAVLDSIAFGWREVSPEKTAHLPKLAGSIGIVIFDPETRLTLAGVVADAEYDPYVLIQMTGRLRERIGEDVSRCRVYLAGNAAVSQEMLDQAAAAGDAQAELMALMSELLFEDDGADQDLNDVLIQREAMLDDLEADGFSKEKIDCRWAEPNQSMTAYFDPVGGFAVTIEADYLV